MKSNETVITYFFYKKTLFLAEPQYSYIFSVNPQAVLYLKYKKILGLDEAWALHYS